MIYKMFIFFTTVYSYSLLAFYLRVKAYPIFYLLFVFSFIFFGTPMTTVFLYTDGGYFILL